MRLPSGVGGAVATEVAGGSPADGAGVHAADVVREINRSRRS